jgi:hypothetical protein
LNARGLGEESDGHSRRTAHRGTAPAGRHPAKRLTGFEPTTFLHGKQLLPGLGASELPAFGRIRDYRARTTSPRVTSDCCGLDTEWTPSAQGCSPCGWDCQAATSSPGQAPVRSGLTINADVPETLGRAASLRHRSRASCRAPRPRPLARRRRPGEARRRGRRQLRGGDIWRQANHRRTVRSGRPRALDQVGERFQLASPESVCAASYGRMRVWGSPPMGANTRVRHLSGVEFVISTPSRRLAERL